MFRGSSPFILPLAGLAVICASLYFEAPREALAALVNIGAHGETRPAQVTTAAPASPKVGAVAPPAETAAAAPIVTAAASTTPVVADKVGSDGRTTQADIDAILEATAKIDINTASVATLDDIPGGGRIGRAIVRHRPYESIEDLLTKRVLRKSVYDRIADQIVAR